MQDNYQVVTDEEIDQCMPKSFGVNTIENLRSELVKGCKAKKEGYWTGSTVFSTMVNMGLVNDRMKSSKTTLTRRGELFLAQESSVSAPTGGDA